MKKIKLGFSLLAASAILLTSCNKKTTEPPVADTEFNSSVDASYANTIVTDIDMITGFLGENQDPVFASPAPGFAATTRSNTPNVSCSYTWASSGVKCRDGKTRSGTILVTYTWTIPNTTIAPYYRDYGFIGKVTLNNYVVDGWMVDDSTVFTIKNEAASATPNPATTKLKWSMNGNFTMRNIADPTKRMTWEGTLNKTLSNTAQLAPTNLTAITWSLAVVEYDGSFKGFTPGNVAYTYSVTTDKPLVRNYTCAPDKVLGISTTPTVSIVNSEYHPFINGVASFTTAAKEPRIIDFGTDGAPCDNSGSVTIKGISYKVDFKK